MIEVINQYDINLLCETWLKHTEQFNLEVKGYESIVICRSITNKRSKRNSGGLVCYIKKDIMEGIERAECDQKSNDRLWLKLSSTFFGLENDTFVCLCYISPETSTHQSSRNNIWNLLKEEIATFSSKGCIILTGDMNARTGIRPDFVPSDSNEHVPLPPNYVADVDIPRTSEDSCINAYGRELLDLCQSARLRIVNGRCGKDSNKGAFTCLTPRGSSLVDYTVVSELFLKRIRNFEVNPVSELSDHCSILTTIAVGKLSGFELFKLNQLSADLLETVTKRLNYSTERDHESIILNHFNWSPDVKERLAKHLASNRSTSYLSMLSSQLPDVSTHVTVSRLTNFLQNALKKCAGIKRKKQAREYSSCSFPRNSWFDEECKAQKKLVRQAGKLLQCNPNDTEARQKFWSEKKDFKALTRRKKRQAIQHLHQKLESLKTLNPRIFWQQINRVAHQESSHHIPISLDNIFLHFKDLNEGPQPSKMVNARPGYEHNNLLDYNIEVEEVRSAIRSMKSNKSPGTDGLAPTIFKLFGDSLLDILTSLYNQVLHTGQYPREWGVGLIKPIHKSGDRSVPNNYRGITLLNVMGKIFSTILNGRLRYWAELNGLLNESQFGFRPGHKTTDPIFILHSAIQAGFTRKTATFACFVDFQKAFDSVEHQLLWQKLARLGVSNKFLRLLQSMYGDASSAVSLNDQISPVFPCKRGVRQGCNLSPLLFCIFIADLEQTLKSKHSGNLTLIHTKLPLLLFADDLVLLADNHTGLQKSLDILAEYCQKWHIQVNFVKTKVLVFSRSRSPGPQNYTFAINQSIVETTNEYKYLGLLLCRNGTYKKAITTLAGQAKKALFCPMTKASRLYYPKPALLGHLFDSLVRPILEYAGEIWDGSIAEEIERVHRRFCKFALGLPQSATNLAIYGELGRCPLEVRRKAIVVKFWLRLATNWDISPLLKEAYLLISSLPSTDAWLGRVKDLLNQTGFSNVWLNPSNISPTDFISEFSQRCKDQYRQAWESEMKASSGKLRTYRLFKKEFCREAYLNLPPYLRVPIAKLRTSAHPLRIETGRYALPTPLPVKERTCWYCTNLVEDEVHFLITCELYQNSNERVRLFDRC